MIRKYLQGGIVPFSNPTYPMARLQGSIYAAPLNYNQPNEVVGGYDARVNPMTGEEIPQANFADGGSVSYGEGFMPPAAFYNPPMDRSRVGFDPNERYLRENAMQGGIGPYIDMLNQQFAAGPRYGTRTGITGVLPWVNPADFPVNPQPSTQPSGPTGGSVNPITGGTYTYPVGDDTGFGGVITLPVLPRIQPPSTTLPPVRGEEEPERKGAVTPEELAPEEQGTPYIDERGVVQIPTTLPPSPAPMGGITLPQEPPRERGGELVLDTNVAKPDSGAISTGTPDYSGSTYGGITASPQEDQGGTDISTYDSQQLQDAGYADWEQQLYGLGSYSTPFSDMGSTYNPNDTFANSNMTGRDLTRLGESGSTFGVSPDTKGSGWSYSDILGTKGGISDLLSGDKSIYNPSFGDVHSVKDFGNYLVDKAKYAGDYATAHPIEVGANLIGALSGIPGGSKAGTVVSNIYDKVTEALKSPNERLADTFIKEHAPEEMSYSDIEKFLAGETDLTGATASDSGTSSATATPTGPDRITIEGLTGGTDLGPGNLTNNYRGTADINAINFLTGAFNGLPYGSPTSMVDMSSMLNPYATPSAAESAMYNATAPSFYDQNKELRDYAASHPIGTADPFREDRNAYFAAHPELNPTTGRLYEQEKTPQEIAAAKAIADEYRALQEAYGVGSAQESAPAAAQEAAPSLDDYYAQLYGMNNYAAGGLASLPEYRAGGKLLRGPGDGMSDDIKANIDGKQEARLATGEFVFPADVVSHLGNGDTEAGAERLYEMMDKIRMARTGSKKQGKQINPHKFLPV